MNNIKGIVFDKDGTLIDFEKSWCPVLKKIISNLVGGDSGKARDLFKRCGADWDSQTFESGSLLSAGTNREIVSEWADFLNRDDIDALEDMFNKYSSEIICDSVVSITPLKQLFTELQKFGIISGIATMDSKMSLEACVKNLDIYDVCKYRVGYDSGYGQKPQATMVRGFCEMHNLKPLQVIVVGDNTHDIHMGKNAGAKYTIGVLSGTSNKQDLVEADFILDSVADLPKFITDFA